MTCERFLSCEGQVWKDNYAVELAAKAQIPVWAFLFDWRSREGHSMGTVAHSLGANNRFLTRQA